jgi:hypothetical protein
MVGTHLTHRRCILASQQLELQRAKSEYRKFHTYLSASQAKFVPLGGHDAPSVVPIEMKRQEVLDCFLKRNPQFERFRAQLAEFRQELFPAAFHLHAERWEEVNKTA